MTSTQTERFVAIDNVCAWPNLTLMPDGTIIATIFNQPTHLLWEGDVECWASADQGRTWKLRGTPAVHEPGTARGNVAAGLAHDGSLVVIVSGWSFEGTPIFGQRNERANVLQPWVCRSTDGGRSWIRSVAIGPSTDASTVIPFGDVVRSPDGALGLSCYSHAAGQNTAHFFRSHDDGRTWGEPPTIIGAGDYNETALLCLDRERWLAASRTHRDAHLDLFTSQDAGSTWTCCGPLTLPGQHPGHLARLADGRILLVYGLRNRGLRGVGARWSPDEGKTWEAPVVLVNLEDATDVGYPASVQVEDGTIVTAYYCNRISAHQRYHMGIVRWRIDERLS
jgi:hypothetical protein